MLQVMNKKLKHFLEIWGEMMRPSFENGTFFMMAI